MLRSRKSQREEPFTPHAPEPVATGTSGSSPEHEARLADSAGLALLVVLDRLTPAERPPSCGVVMAPRGRLFSALRLTIANGKITEIEVIGDPVRLRELDLSIVD